MKTNLDQYKGLKMTFTQAPYKNWAIGFALILYAAVFGMTVEFYPGTLWVIVAFNLTFLALIISAWPRPRTDAYFFLAIFLFLGFWVKFTIHLIFPYPLMEPVGAFDGSASEWDIALNAATAAAFGAVFFRIIYLSIAQRRLRSLPRKTMININPPNWYLRYPGKIWGVVIVLTLILYTANYFFAFFQTGVDSHLILPFGMNAALAWSSFCGAALAFALLAGWETIRRPNHFAPLVWSVCLFGIVASVSLASRAISVFLFAAYAIALGVHFPVMGKKLLSSWRWRLPLIMGASLIASLVLVSAFRLNNYLVPNKEFSEAGLFQNHSSTRKLDMGRNAMFKQVMQLGVDRWIGLEGMLAVTGSSERGVPLLVAGLRESPKKGVNSIYQKIARSPYSFERGFTFLTLPGAPTILFYGGSLILVLVGMFFFTCVLTIVENFGMRMTGSRFVCSVLGVFMANAVCQMSFPYLWMVFVIENVIALGAIGILRFWSENRKLGSFK